ncbi:MAG: hypothetical protein ACI4TY_01820 [Candidatus Limosilactobacillus intestinavium]
MNNKLNQKVVLKRLFKAAQPFWWQFLLATLMAILVSVVNLLLPRMVLLLIITCEIRQQPFN